MGGRNKKGFNSYKIEGDKTILYDKKKSGEMFEIFINTEDLPKLIELNYHWFTTWRDKIQGYYAATTEYLGYVEGKPKYKTIYLHKIIANYDSTNKIHINHKNHDTLDDTRDNLEIIESEFNLKSRKSKNGNNTSGYRNVSQIGKWWCIQLQINGVNTLLKKFPLDQLDEAGIYAEQMRELHYKNYKGLS